MQAYCHRNYALCQYEDSPNGDSKTLYKIYITILYRIFLLLNKWNQEAAKP